MKCKRRQQVLLFETQNGPSDAFFCVLASSSLLSPHSGITFRILVSLPPTYPDSSPPQLQLLSRYIGAFQIDATLFSGVLKTYISSSGVERHEGEVAVFDGIERTREVIQRWYEERLSESILREVMREDGKAQHVHQVEAVPTTSQTKGTDSPTGGGIPAGPELSLVPLPDGIEIYEAGAITDRKSSFVGRACRITHPSQVSCTTSIFSKQLISLLGTGGAVTLDVRSPDCSSGTSGN